MNLFKRSGLVVALLLASGQAWSAEVQVAVAANFSKPLEVLATAFKASSGHELNMSAGASGKLYAQIENGAPFEVFLSADSKTPQKLVEAQLAVAESQFTYALGKLVLWSSTQDYIDPQGEVLKKQEFKHLAIANPQTAPYGAAAVEALDHLGLKKSLESKLVQGENISQTYDFVSTGNAELGFVAWSQVAQEGVLKAGSVWQIPEDLYTPIQQDAVLLLKGKDNKAAQAFLDFLKTPQAQQLITKAGYGLAKPH
ncbi:MAG: molybdate ABC transporter substrate-binding protein [Thiothrix sp.]|nr:MAG: molybdate ABC transporter substrate-binding protein [Thiothrix sp.]